MSESGIFWQETDKPTKLYKSEYVDFLGRFSKSVTIIDIQNIGRNGTVSNMDEKIDSDTNSNDNLLESIITACDEYDTHTIIYSTKSGNQLGWFVYELDSRESVNDTIKRASVINGGIVENIDFKPFDTTESNEESNQESDKKNENGEKEANLMHAPFCVALQPKSDIKQLIWFDDKTKSIMSAILEPKTKQNGKTETISSICASNPKAIYQFNTTVVTCVMNAICFESKVLVVNKKNKKGNKNKKNKDKFKEIKKALLFFQSRDQSDILIGELETKSSIAWNNKMMKNVRKVKNTQDCVLFGVGSVLNYQIVKKQEKLSVVVAKNETVFDWHKEYRNHILLNVDSD